MAPGGRVVKRRVTELEHGDVTLEYGLVTHREGRKVWFETRIVTFPTEDEQLTVLEVTE